MRLFLFAAFAVLTLAAQPALALPEKYTFDKGHTQILFFVNHMGYSNSQGEFHDYDGHFIFDQDKPETSAAEVVIQTASIDMDMERWDDHMKNEDFFNVEKFPTMTFKSTNVTVTGEKTADVTGDFTLLGVTKPVTLHVTFNKAAPRMNGEYVAGFSATGMLKRSDFGMSYGLPMVSDEVELRIEVEGVREHKEGQEPLNP